MKYLFVLWLSIVTSTAPIHEGRASYYSPSLQGHRTANGEVYDRHELTAAHRTLPFGTIIRVVNVRNGKSVFVRINDRGPYVRGRQLDLSGAAMDSLSGRSRGVVHIQYQIIG